MSDINVQLLIRDREYADALAAALTKNDNRLHVTWEQATAKSGMDLYLAEEDDGMLRVIAADMTHGEKSEHFSRYANIRDLAGNLVRIYGESKGMLVSKWGSCDVEIICVVSSSGGTGSSSIAEGLAAEMMKFRGCRTLLITLGLMEDGSAGTKGAATAGEEENNIRSGRRSLKEFAYRMLGREEELPGAVEPYLWQDENGVWHPAEWNGRNPLNGLTADEFSLFVNRTACAGGFEAVVIDAGNMLTEAAAEAVRTADKICFIKGRADKSYSNWLKMNCDVSKAIIRTENMQSKGRQRIDLQSDGIQHGVISQTSTDEPDVNVTIPFDPTILRDGVNLAGDFGVAVRELAKVMGL